MNDNLKGSPVVISDDGLEIVDFVETDPRTVAAARRWQGGRLEAGEDGDLKPWVSVVLSLGAQVAELGEASGGIASLASTVNGLAARAEAASSTLADEVARATITASEAAVLATRQAAEATVKGLAEAKQQVAQECAQATRAARETVNTELKRLLGGVDSDAARGIADLVRQQMAEADARLTVTMSATLDRASAAWDVDNPASAVAGLERRLAERQDRAQARLLLDLERVREGVSAVAATAQAHAAVAAVQAGTTLKGRPFEDRAGAVLEAAAASMGGSYMATGDTAGAVRLCKKGDGVLELPSPVGATPVRVVVEMTTTGGARKWGAYLDEALRNRQADAAIGIVPTADLVPGGAALAVVGERRLVLALDDIGGGALLNAAVTLLTLQVQRAAAEAVSGAAATEEADRRLGEAQTQLTVLAETLRHAQAVRTGAGKVVAGLEAAHEALTRCLLQARAALAPRAVTAAA